MYGRVVIGKVKVYMESQLMDIKDGFRDRIGCIDKVSAFKAL